MFAYSKLKHVLRKIIYNTVVNCVLVAHVI